MVTIDMSDSTTTSVSAPAGGFYLRDLRAKGKVQKVCSRGEVESINSGLYWISMF